MAFRKSPPNTHGRQRAAVKPVQRHCFFCTHHIEEPDFKDVQLLGKFVSSYKKIAPRRRSGVCAKHQRRLAVAIKRARQLALMPYIPE